MEINEGDIKISQVPYVTIGDKELHECEWWRIKREFVSLVKKIGEQRERIAQLEKELASK